MENKNLHKEQFFKLISARIKQARVKNGMNQSDLAEKLGISRTSMINIEQGRHFVNLYMLSEIAFHLNILIADLIPPRNLIEDLTQISETQHIKVDDLKQLKGVEYNKEDYVNIQHFLQKITKEK